MNKRDLEVVQCIISVTEDLGEEDITKDEESTVSIRKLKKDQFK